MKVLIVEDELIIADDIKTILTSEKHKITGIVQDGHAAIKSIEKNTPDVVMMDISLKGDLDGIQTANLIFDKYQIRVIFLTSFFQKIPENAQEAHPYAFLIKPVVHEEIVQTLKKIQEQQRSLYTLKDSGAFPQETFYSKILNC
jgi:CheY-like chemotaxis protein